MEGSSYRESTVYRNYIRVSKIIALTLRQVFFLIIPLNFNTMI